MNVPLKILWTPQQENRVIAYNELLSLMKYYLTCNTEMLEFEVMGQMTQWYEYWTTLTVYYIEPTFGIFILSEKQVIQSCNYLYTFRRWKQTLRSWNISFSTYKQFWSVIVNVLQEFVKSSQRFVFHTDIVVTLASHNLKLIYSIATGLVIV